MREKGVSLWVGGGKASELRKRGLENKYPEHQFKCQGDVMMTLSRSPLRRRHYSNVFLDLTMTWNCIICGLISFVCPCLFGLFSL